MPSPAVIGASSVPLNDRIVKSLQPRHWYRADTYTLSGGNLATLPNRGSAGGQLAVAAGTIAAPATDATLGGAQSFALTGTQHLTASHAPAEFRFFHDGTSRTAIIVTILTATPALGGLLATRASAGTGIGAMVYTATAALSQVVGNGSANTFTPLPTTAAGAVAINTPHLIESTYSETAAPESFLAVNSVVLASGASGGAPSTGVDPTATLHVGRFSDGSPMQGRIGEVLLFDRVLTPYERQLVREYIAARYGIAAPVWSAEDRAILQLNPFSWIRADSYSTSGGKVTAFLDKVLPGHSFAQGTGANQVNDPATSANWNGQLVCTFAGSQYYDSSLAAAPWGFLHSGTGRSVWTPFRATTATGAFILSSNRYQDTATQSGLCLGYQTSTLRLLERVSRANAVPTYDLSAAAALVVGTKFLIRAAYSETTTPKYLLAMNGTTAASSSTTNTPSVAAPNSSLRLGANRVTNDLGMVGEWPEKISFSRVLTTAEAATVSAYFASRYGAF